MVSASGWQRPADCACLRVVAPRAVSACQPDGGLIAARIGSIFAPSFAATRTPVLAIETLKKRSSFLRVRGGGRWATGAFVLEGKPRAPLACPAGESSRLRAHEADVVQGTAAHPTDLPRFGFTVTKKLGNAVARNRIRRRLKAAVSQVAPLGARADCDYVIIAREAALTRPFLSITQDLDNAFERVHQSLRKPGGSGGKSSRRARTERTKGQDRS